MRFYTHREAAIELQKSTRTLDRMRIRFRERGLAFGCKVGGAWQYSETDITKARGAEPWPPTRELASVSAAVKIELPVMVMRVARGSASFAPILIHDPVSYVVMTLLETITSLYPVM